MDTRIRDRMCAPSSRCECPRHSMVRAARVQAVWFAACSSHRLPVADATRMPPEVAVCIHSYIRGLCIVPPRPIRIAALDRRAGDRPAPDLGAIANHAPCCVDEPGRSSLHDRVQSAIRDRARQRSCRPPTSGRHGVARLRLPPLPREPARVQHELHSSQTDELLGYCVTGERLCLEIRQDLAHPLSYQHDFAAAE